MHSASPGFSGAAFAALFSVIVLAGCGGGGSSASSGTANESYVAEANSSGGEAVYLSWLAPAQRVNGEQLSYQTDIDGYIVRYGQSPSELDQQAVVDCEVLECGYNVNGLSSGTWYFAVQTVDSNGLISAPSAPVSRTL
ncbi:hypothetical protein SAMN04487962_104194 [Marinobacter segnicrescens]|uniref:Fibronectin type-III domain-containing protein n=1 Tax=Marinobacter segnicrescens TaxID=430453 RepID=A0A1I0BVH1_9GAMM|nr:MULTISPECIES: fibronectin type III domain-containing protein [Marinobacter]UZD67277.1 fibronectin type III domain-containing protein [Marinobacter sp. AN1]SET11066.1 hypothetical protein SAMN04487962_104194 [Marinobacter segnicrescens]